MKGYQLTFFTQQDHRHENKPMAEWLMLTARNLGLCGATIVAASEGYGQHRHIHSSHFLELADQPQEIVMAASKEEVDLLFDHLRKESVNLFYIKAPVEFGMLDDLDKNTYSSS